MMSIERRYIPAGLTVRDAAKGPGTISGHAAVFYDANDPGTRYMLWDDVEERVMPGAFDRALAEKDDTRVLVDHNPSMLIGRTSAGTARLSVDARGLAYEADAPDTQVGRDVVTSIRRKDITGSSFGFMVERDEVKRETRDGKPYYVREIQSVRLFDVSPVTFPAYEGTDTSARMERRASILTRLADADREADAIKARIAADEAVAEGEGRARDLELRRLASL